MEVQELNGVIRSWMDKAHVDFNTGVRLLLHVPCPDTEAAHHRINQVLLALTIITQHVHLGPESQVVAMSALLKVPQSECTVASNITKNHSDPLSRPLVRRFLLPGPFCHRDLVRDQ